jgi:hypothetical protein
MLANDLKLDSKELVELFTEAGIHVGSALASLSEGEVAKETDHIAGRDNRSVQKCCPTQFEA